MGAIEDAGVGVGRDAAAAVAIAEAAMETKESDALAGTGDEAMGGTDFEAAAWLSIAAVAPPPFAVAARWSASQTSKKASENFDSGTGTPGKDSNATG